MSEGNCNCCCAYLNPPWWVTMGYTPPAGFQGQGSPPSQGIPAGSQPPAQRPLPQGIPAASQPPAQRPLPQGIPAASQPALQVAASGATPPVTGGKLAGDILTGRVDQVVQDFGKLLGLL